MLRSSRLLLPRSSIRRLCTSASATSAAEQVLVDEDGCFVAYYPTFLSHQAQQSLFDSLSAEVPWKVETDDFGLQSRHSYFMADEGCTFKVCVCPNA